LNVLCQILYSSSYY